MAAAFVVVGLLALTGCSTGDDAVVQGDTFQFVSPGGKTVIDYSADERKPIGPLAGEDLQTGGPLSVADPRFAGKVMVVNVWASWCGPCRSEADDLEQVFQQTASSGVAFLGINLRDDRDSARDFVGDRRITYPTIYDPDGATLRDLGIPAPVVPTTVILDRSHRPAVVFIKPIHADDLAAKVAEVAAEAPPAAPTPSAPIPSAPIPSAPEIAPR